MAVSIETSVQNAVIAMSIINITFAHDNVSASAAVVIPMCYSAFTSCTNFFWALIAMKLGEAERGAKEGWAEGWSEATARDIILTTHLPLVALLLTAACSSQD